MDNLHNNGCDLNKVNSPDKQDGSGVKVISSALFMLILIAITQSAQTLTY